MTRQGMRFVLIDQSVQKPGGHHYEYAQRILDAAKEQGYETALFAHKNYRGQVSHEVRPVFSWTFWENFRFYYEAMRWGGRRVRPKSYRDGRMAAKLNRKRRLLYSPFGLAVARARHLFLRDIILQPHLVDDFSSVPSGRFILMIGKLAIFVVAWRDRLRPTVGRVTRGLQRLLGLGGAAIVGPFALSALLIRRRLRGDPAKRFADEITRASRPGELTGEPPLFFVPNATAAELEGLGLLADRGHPLTGARWAFLYRRPVFTGLPETYSHQNEQVRRHRLEFARLKRRHPELNVRFYTDTDELTAQYNFLHIYPFATLPVPSDAAPPQKTRAGAALTVGYLGDARDEKGFGLLPALVERFRSDGTAHRAVRFLFQANFNVPQGEPATRYARGLLQSVDSDLVELVFGPFDSADYLALLKRMDVVLIPYQASNYLARSSGVLMEAVSGRRPAVVPAMSWMAGVAEPFRRRHCEALLAGKPPLFEMHDALHRLNDKVLPIDPRATHICFRLRFDRRFNSYVRIMMTSLNGFDLPIDFTTNTFKAADGEVVALFAKPPSEKVWWKAEVFEVAERTGPAEAELALYAFSKPVPLSAGIGIYDRPEDLPATCADIVDHFAFHRRAMDEIAMALKPLYDPGELVARLTERHAARIPTREAAE